MAALMRLQRAAWTHLGDRDALGGAMLRAYETCDACISENRLFRGADEIQRLAAAIEAAVEGDRPDRPEAEEPFQIDTRLLRRGTSRG